MTTPNHEATPSPRILDAYTVEECAKVAQFYPEAQKKSPAEAGLKFREEPPEDGRSHRQRGGPD